MDQDTGARRGGQRIVGLVAILAWGGAFALFAALLFGEVYRPDPAAAGAIETRLVFAALLIQTFSFHAGIAAVGACLVAVMVKRRRLGLTLGLGGVLLLGPVAWSHVAPGTMATRGDGDLVVMSANVLYVNDDPALFIERVLEVDPDVVLIQEYRASWSEPIRRAMGERYPYRVELPMRGAFGEAVLSKREFLEEPVFAPEGWAWDNPLIVVAIEHGGERVEIGNVHLWAPLSWEAVGEQRRQAALLGAWAEARMASDDAPAALILAGDFNAPFRTNHLRELRSAGLQEAHDVRGAGRGATWKPRRALVSWAPGVRLDHVMFAGEALCTGSGVGRGIGSDHLPVWASFRVGGE